MFTQRATDNVSMSQLTASSVCMGSVLGLAPFHSVTNMDNGIKACSARLLTAELRGTINTLEGERCHSEVSGQLDRCTHL